MTRYEINLAVGRKLAQRRQVLGLSLAQVSERCGVSLQQVHKYETAQSTIAAPMLLQLARCLGVKVAYFFEDLETEAAP